MPKKRIGILISGRGSNMEAIAKSVQSGYIPAEIAAVVSDNHGAKGLITANNMGLRTDVLKKETGQMREEYDLLLGNMLEKYGVNIICLAGFMRILSPSIIKRFPEGVLNIHPALLPSFPGLHVQKMAIDYGVRFSGCTVHFVDEEVDHGPIILQAIVPVFNDDTEESLSERILKKEHYIYPESIRLLCEGKIEKSGRRVVIREDSKKLNEIFKKCKDTK